MATRGVTGGTTNLGVLAPEYGFGDDIVGVVSGNNQIYAWEGNDLVYTTRATAGSTQLANLGTGQDRFLGGAGNDSVYDGPGNDTISTGDGGDFVFAGAGGNDVYTGGTGTDLISFYFLYNELDFYAANAAPVTLDLAKTTQQNLGFFGLDIIREFENAEGGDGSDRLYGTSGSNTLYGLAGNDVLDGRAGNDLIYGGEGSDFIIGGTGRDELFGTEFVAVLDRFRFVSFADSSSAAASADLITGFSAGGGSTNDRIDLYIIDADPTVAGNQNFTFRSGSVFTSIRGEVRVQTSGADTLVLLDNDTDVAAEMIIRVVGVTGLTVADFVL